MDKSTFEKIVESVGSQRQLALSLGVTPQALTKWKVRGIPAERVLDVERLSGVSRYEIRPDVFGAPESAA